jgi:hypothetical protein
VLAEAHPIDLSALQPYLPALTIGLAAVTLLLFLLVLLLLRRTSRLARRIDRPRRADVELDPADHGSVEAVIRSQDELEARMAVVEGLQRRSFQRVGLVRFNPFEDTGGNQSFAIALLDEGGDGFVLSSLHARAGTRVYAKTIAGGKAEASLSKEEQEALRLALGSFGEARRAS